MGLKSLKNSGLHVRFITVRPLWLLENMKGKSQGVLNGKVSALNGDRVAFDELVKPYPREMQVKAFRHFLTPSKIKGKK